MAEDYTYTTVTDWRKRAHELARDVNELTRRVQELERENAELRTKLSVVQVYARGIYGEVPPLSFDDWYALVRREVQP